MTPLEAALIAVAPVVIGLSILAGLAIYGFLVWLNNGSEEI